MIGNRGLESQEPLGKWPHGHQRTSAAKQQTVQSSKPSSSNAKPSGGQGYEQNPLVRKAIENRAMQVAKSVYEKNGYSVEDTSANGSHLTLDAQKEEREILVEVKGTRVCQHK